MKNRALSLARQGWTWVVIGLVVVLLALAASVLANVRLRQGSPGSLRATPTIDPHLIVQAHTVPVTGILGSDAVGGTLYPGLPGPNTVHLTVHGLDMRASSPNLTLVATMPGMMMVPATARLQAHHDTYSGVISLGMFGTYTAEISLKRGVVPQHGTVQLSVPLILDP